MAEPKRTDLSAKLNVAGMSATVLAMGTGFATDALATPMITGPGLNVDIVNSGVNGPYPLDLNNDGNPDFYLFNLIQDSGSPNYTPTYFTSGAFTNGNNNGIEGKNIPPPDTSYSPIYNKAYANNPGDTVGPGYSFVPSFAKLQGNDATTGYPYGGLWPEGEQRFLGLVFDIPDPQDPTNGTPTTHYGFAAITLAEGTAAMNLDCYGYETEANAPIVKSCGANTVPEPGSLLLLAAGAVPLLALRRRRVRH